MPKYYVESGFVSRIVVAEDAQGAALATIHKLLSDSIDVNSNNSLIELIEEDDVVSVIQQLGESISISEIGFGRSESGQFEVEQIIESWHQMMVAIENMFNNFE